MATQTYKPQHLTGEDFRAVVEQSRNQASDHLKQCRARRIAASGALAALQADGDIDSPVLRRADAELYSASLNEVAAAASMAASEGFIAQLIPVAQSPVKPGFAAPSPDNGV